jgi:hypothetical protein
MHGLIWETKIKATIAFFGISLNGPCRLRLDTVCVLIVALSYKCLCDNIKDINMTKQRIIYVLVGVILLAGMCWGAWDALRLNALRPSRSQTPVAGGTGALSAGGSGSLSIDWSNDRIMMGASHYVFVGRVSKRVSAIALTPKYTTEQFAVDVVMNIKGILQGTVIVNQFEINNFPVVQPGSTYVFATSYIKDKDWYNFAVFPYGYSLISQDSTLDAARLKTLAEQNDRVIALQKAYPNEILLESDVKRNTAWNSYQSLKSGHLFTPPPFVESAPSSEPKSESVVVPTPESVEPSVAPTPTTEPTVEPTLTPEPTATPAPEITPTPTPELTPTPEPTATPTVEATPTPESTPIESPAPTATPEPTAS